MAGLGVGQLHGVVERLAVLADVVEMEEIGEVFGDGAIVRDALVLAFPAGADLGLADDFEGDLPTGGVLAAVHVAERAAAAVLQHGQSVHLFLWGHVGGFLVGGTVANFWNGVYCTTLTAKVHRRRCDFAVH